MSTSKCKAQHHKPDGGSVIGKDILRYIPVVPGQLVELADSREHSGWCGKTGIS